MKSEKLTGRYRHLFSLSSGIKVVFVCVCVFLMQPLEEVAQGTHRPLGPGFLALESVIGCQALTQRLEGRKSFLGLSVALSPGVVWASLFC